MKQLLPVFLIIALCQLANAQGEVQKFYSAARTAFIDKKYDEYYSLIFQAYELHPYHQGILYHCGVSSALKGESQEAISFLRRTVQIDARYNLNIPELSVLNDEVDFKNLLKEQAQLKERIVSSDTAFTIKERAIHLESIAQGEKDGVYYGASIRKRKIIKIEKSVVSDFITQLPSMGAVMTVKMDHKTNTLWAASSPLKEMENYDSTVRSSVSQFDQKGNLINQIFLDNPSSVLGGMLISPEGKVYISDTGTNTIYTANQSTGKLDIFFTSPEFWNIQGITFDDNNKYLFIADYVKGIFRLDLKAKTLIQLPLYKNISCKSVDGLLYYNNGLVTIQNGTNPMRVVYLKLNENLSEFINHTVIDQEHPAFNEPTNGFISGDHLFYVANSQWAGYTEGHQPKPDDQLQDIVILKTNLSNLKR